MYLFLVSQCIYSNKLHDFYFQSFSATLFILYNNVSIQLDTIGCFIFI